MGWIMHLFYHLIISYCLFMIANKTNKVVEVVEAGSVVEAEVLVEAEGIKVVAEVERSRWRSLLRISTKISKAIMLKL